MSRHGVINVYPANQEGTCDQCHTGEGAMNRLGISFRNFDAGDYTGTNNHMAITCLICHDPHGDVDEGLLRFPINAPSLAANLCTQCHNERGNPDPMNERQPHAPAGPLLLGSAGWWPPSAPRSNIVGAHGDASRNEKLCATCHVDDFATAGFAYQSTGHVFSGTPCLDAAGKPTMSDDCVPEQRYYGACTGSGCHGDESGARAAQAEARSRLTELTIALRALLAEVPRSEFNDSDAGLTIAEGARFNAQLADRRGSEVHNPALLEVLLLGSMQAVEDRYGLMADATLARTPLFQLN